MIEPCEWPLWRTRRYDRLWPISAGQGNDDLTLGRLLVVGACGAQEQIALREIWRSDQVTLADELLKILVGQDAVLERKPPAVTTDRLCVSRFGDRRATVLAKNPKPHRSIVAESGRREQCDGWWWEGGFNASALTKRPRYYQDMQPVPFPRRRYFPPGAAAAIGVILNAARLTTFGADLLNVDHIIWGSAALGGIVVGFPSADLSTSSSALRRWIRYRTRLFDVLAVWPLYESLRNRDYFMVSLRFVVRLDGASAILRLKSSGAAQHETAIDLVQNLTRAEGSELRLAIATFEYGRPDNMMLAWGDPASCQTTLGGAVKCVATIDVQRKALFRRRQTFSIYVEKTNVDAGRVGRILFIIEDEEFPAIKR